MCGAGWKKMVQMFSGGTIGSAFVLDALLAVKGWGVLLSVGGHKTKQTTPVKMFVWGIVPTSACSYTQQTAVLLPSAVFLVYHFSQYLKKILDELKHLSVEIG